MGYRSRPPDIRFLGREQVIEVDVPGFKAPSAAEAARFVKGRPAPSGARNLSARPYTK